MSYLDVCAAAVGERDADAVAELVRSALTGAVLAAEQVRIRCDSPTQVRSFDVFVSSRLDDGGRCVGATVALAESDPLITDVDVDEAASVRALLTVAGVVAGELSLNQLLGRVADAARVLTGAGHVTVEMRRGRARTECSECAARPAAEAEHASGTDGRVTVALDAVIRSRGIAVAHLHAGAAPGRTFADHERRLLARLAAVAGTAVANTQLYQDTERQRRWSVDAAELMQSLLGPGPADPVRTVLERTVDDLDCDLAEFVLLSNGTTSRVGNAIGRTVNGPRVSAPVTAQDQRIGTLTIARLDPGADFTEDDVESLAGYARFAALAVDLARARHDHEVVRSLEIRDRIAAELREQVVREAFSVGMRLEGVLDLITHPLARERVSECVADLDAMVSAIRDTVYHLDEPGDEPD